MRLSAKFAPRLALAAGSGVVAVLLAVMASAGGHQAGTPTRTVAVANSTVNINPGNLKPPPTAESFPNHECSANMGGGPFPGQDVWVFVLPNHNTTGDFVSVHLTFSTPNGTVTRDIPADQPSGILLNGNSFAWIRTPAGWTLTAASAEITGTADFFNLTHTCPASGSTPTPSMSPSTSPTASPTSSPSTSPSMSRSPSPTPSRTHSPSPTPSRTHSPRPSPSHGYYNGGAQPSDTSAQEVSFWAWLASFF
jgi:hypothetical protein